MSDFMERARAEAYRRWSYFIDQAGIENVRQAGGFIEGAEWAYRLLMAEPTEDEIEDAASRPCRDVDVVDVHTIIAAFLEARRRSE